jgi:hypothetical protein
MSSQSHENREKQLMSSAILMAALGDGPLAEQRGQNMSMANDREQAAIDIQ